MVSFHLAYTAPINPSDASPTLTVPQVWAGMERKAKNAHEFVPAITECVVEKEEVNEKGHVVVTRVVKFKEGMGPPGDVREVCVHFKPAKVDYHQENGSLITNIISNGPSGKPEDMYMTFAFDWLHPELEDEDGKEARKLKERYQRVAKMAVDTTIDTIRRLVQEGEIQ
ncbi:hypothetical protein H2201_008352 [Coniosporium apollinis]|uniref:DUF1857-domain-containing protein n=2 Tax=Coniosporium TaxID=2810619 RepID=A0ABQ9NGD8_9PEZI|nr:hypothetical protein H2199_004870 [Cladosporium sp. JES 115]KAJ9656949.1 hypothetical protein H2201_008352 [Coniosporium apollinis]